jgi:F0F1-type ATP synthase assembly protein I
MMTDEPTSTPPVSDRTDRIPIQSGLVDAPEKPEEGDAPDSAEQPEQPGATEPAGEPPAAPEEPDRVVPTPAAGTIAVLALAWLLAMLSSARRTIGVSADGSPLTVTRAALELPQVISASLIAGIAVGLVTNNLLARFAPTAPARPMLRLAVGAGAGVLTGLLVATPIMLEYGGLPSIIVLSGAVATAAALGGLLAGVRHRAVIAAGACGALGVFLVGLVERAFQPNLRQLFGAGDSPESVVVATGWAALTASIVAGLVAGVLGYLYLRRSGPDRLRWPAYLAAGATPGLLVLLAELVTRLGGARLFQLVSTASDNDQRVLTYFHEARLNRALIVVFVGALVAIFLLGRTLRPAADEDAS